MLAEVPLRQGVLHRATAVLGPLVAGTNRPDLREHARALLSLVATAISQSGLEANGDH